MVLNDFREDITRLCAAKGISKAQLAKQMGVPRQAIADYELHAGMSSGILKALDCLGYDVEIMYVKRRGNADK